MCACVITYLRLYLLVLNVLLNLFNELGERDKMRDLPSISVPFSQRV